MTTNFMYDPATAGTGALQPALAFESSPTGGEAAASTDTPGTSTSPPSTARPVFFPSNREDILLQLSSLAFSSSFPAGVTVVPIRDDTLALLPDGLRTDEISLLQDGRVERFPVLVELRESVRAERAVIGISEVAALHFRSQGDADDFRFRPVDEVNTEEMTCSVEPRLFDLPGVARFQNRSQRCPELQVRGHFADRLAGGICSLLELGAIETSCWKCIADLICHSGEVGPLHEITLQGAFALEPASALNLGQADAVLQAFITHAAGGGGRELVGKVHANLASGTADAGKIRTADRWATMANAVIQNRASLGGDLLSDQGSVALRAALLASVADDVRALIPFIHAPRPAGRRVIVAAAFLIGLRTGVTDMPWAVKRAHLTTLSPLIVALREAVPEERQRVGREFQIEPDETPVGVVLRLLWNDQEVACWKSCEIEGSDRKAIVEHERSGGDGNFITNLVPQPSKADSAGASISSDNATPENEKQNCIRSHGGRLIELFRPEPPQQRGVTMRCALSETDRLRKPKEILEAACSGGLLWRVGVSSEATAALYADLPDWPDDSMLGELSRTLEHALGVYLVKKKSRAAASPRQRKAGGKKLSVESAP